MAWVYLVVAGLLETGWARGFVERFTKSGRVVRTSSIRGFLQLDFIAALKRPDRHTVWKEAGFEVA